jgi:PAS domain S-box-containing protein
VLIPALFPETEAQPSGQEKELWSFVESMAVPLHRLAEDGTIIWANQAELRLLGYAASEYLGHNIREFHIDREVISEILSQLRRGGEVQGREARLRCRNGDVRVVEISSSVYREGGRFIHARSVSLDITQRTIEAEVRKRLAAIVESSTDAVLSKDLNGTILSWNRGAERIFGYTAQEVIGKHISILAAPDRVDEFPDILDRIRRGEHVEHYETRRRTKDGRIRRISLTVSPIRDAGGVVIGASKVARDITDQSELAQIQERLVAIVESSDDAILSKDLNGIIQSWNAGAQRLFGYTAAEIIGKSITVLAAPGHVDEIPNILNRIRLGERIDHYETKRQAKDGRILTISLTVSPVRDADGKIVGASKVARDITERYEQEAAIREANAALTRANADLQHFTYSASHDLQEPLRTVTIYTELLQKQFQGKLGDVGDQYLAYTLQGALRMQKLLSALRTYTQVATGGAEIETELDTNAVLRKSLEDLRDSISETGASVTQTDLPPVRLHEFQLTQIFQNLIGNAIHYRGPDPIRIQIAAQRHGSDWLFSVSDNGIGIEPQFHEKIFGLFQRLHTVAEYPGTGMGLAICRQIVERAGGRIWVESEPGKGSTFFFTIPVHT